MLTPTFHFQILEKYIDVYNSCSYILVEKLRKKATGKKFNVYPDITLCTLDVICETAMGTSVNAQKHSDSEYVKSVQIMNEIIRTRLFSPFKRFNCIYYLTSDYQAEKRALKTIHGHTTSVIEKRKKELEENGNYIIDCNSSSKKRLAFLDLLLQCELDEKPLTNEQIREEVDTFMFEGHDTTASAIAFSLYCLAENPHVQDLAVNELSKIFTSKDDQILHKHLQQMRYLEKVIKEALRLYPSVPIFGRQLQEDAEFDGAIIPKGVTITTFAYGMHRDPKLYPDPEKFDPERFTLENQNNRNPFAYVPFSAGPRNCIGDKWRKHRKIITPAFHFQILEEFVDVFNSAGDILVKKLEEQCEKGSVDVYPFVTRCALDIICETAMGTSVNAQDDVNSEYVKCVDILLGILIDRAFSPFLQNEFLYRFSNTYRIEQQALKVVHGYSRSVINKRMTEFLKNQKEEESCVDIMGIKKKKAFLDLLLEYSSKDPSFTFDDICQEVDTFMFEGHDTTATSISFALFSLAQNPDIQRKVYTELQSIFASNPKRSATYQDLQEMHYLEIVIKESLRIYTTIPFFGRTIEEDTVTPHVVIPKGTMCNLFTYATHHSELSYKDPEKFDADRFTVESTQRKSPFTFVPFSAGFRNCIDGLLIPKGSVVNVSAYGVHRDPVIYPDPEKFNPERFNPDLLQTNSPFAYVPFSAGPRNCIGQKFAMLQMESILSNIIRSFEVRSVIPDHKIILKSEAVLKADNGILIRLIKRD
ncbi:cytochrome p450 family 4 [Holotrichia oblita]|uniref:Cytochrome p450 family 4 n=1 Tax=Holotrichia oblita TaxID=644536 RepID=A0ACB9TGQ4_HOLOL|nr:cytochrome p450 family 4 [Holotrichia oblita]